jgi:hypothetical protein
MDENLSCLIGLIVLGVAGGISYYLTRLPPRCPECDSKHTQEIRKEPLRIIDGGASVGAGTGGGGGYGTAGVHYNVTRKCLDCDAKWTMTVTET